MGAKKKKRSWVKTIAVAILLAALAFIAYFVYQTTVLADFKPEPEKVTYCHSTGERKWDELKTSALVIFQSGHPRHENDIIPPFDYFVKEGRKWVKKHFDGLNWPRGQEVLKNGCKLPEPPPPTCEVESYSCQACQNDPNEYRERLGICYDKFVGYCGETYGCHWESDCPELATHLISECKREWVCKDTCEQPTPTPSPEPTPEPTPEVRTISPAGAPPVCEGKDLGPWAPTITKVWREDSDTVGACWTESTENADDYILWYGLTEDNLPWNKYVQNETCTTVDLPDHPNVHVWFQVQATDNCVVGQLSLPVDP